MNPLRIVVMLTEEENMRLELWAFERGLDKNFAVKQLLQEAMESRQWRVKKSRKIGTPTEN